MRHALLGACAAVLLSGCGGANEPASGGVRSLLTVGQSEEAAECEAELLEESGMSDEGAVKVAVGVGSNTAMDDDFDLDEIVSDLSGEDRREFEKVAKAFEDCLD